MINATNHISLLQFNNYISNLSLCFLLFLLKIRNIIIFKKMILWKWFILDTFNKLTFKLMVQSCQTFTGFHYYYQYLLPFKLSGLFSPVTFQSWTSSLLAVFSRIKRHRPTCQQAGVSKSGGSEKKMKRKNKQHAGFQPASHLPGRRSRKSLHLRRTTFSFHILHRVVLFSSGESGI